MNSQNQVIKLDGNSVDSIKALYENFKERSLKDYLFELAPLDFVDFANCIKKELLTGFILMEDSTPKAFLIYTAALNDSIELNLIHCIDDIDLQQRRLTLLSHFIEEIKKENNWKVISYPMMGIQDSFVHYITHFDFELVGQAVVKFDFSNDTSKNIFSKIEKPQIPQGFSIEKWKNEYSNEIIKVIYEAFKNTRDADFDPRYKTLDGSLDILLKIVENVYGDFLSDSTRVLKHHNAVVGVCFTNLTASTIANIPLIGLKEQFKGKGLGNALLHASTEALLDMQNQGVINVREINASVDTDNHNAIKMYRKMGYKEDFSYTHAFLKNENSVYN